jgi:hypothetical protein
MSQQAKNAAHALGLRDTQGGDVPTTTRGLPVRVARTSTPSQSDLTRFLMRWAQLAIPSRMMVAMDVSMSMQTMVPGTGLTRLELASRAASGVGNLLPDTSSVGLLAFAQNLDGARPYRVLSAVAPLCSQDGDDTHRNVVLAQLRNLGRQLAGGGTSLYATALAAVRAQRDSFDPRAANSVVLFTDGTNTAGAGLTLAQVTTTLSEEAAAAPQSPVRLICIGLGTGIDLPALQALADSTGGAAYQALTADQLQSVLYDAIARRA